MNQTTALSILINDLNVDIGRSIDSTNAIIRSNSPRYFSMIDQIIRDADLEQPASRMARIDALSGELTVVLNNIFDESFVASSNEFRGVVAVDSFELATGLNRITERTGFRSLNVIRIFSVVSSSNIRGTTVTEYRESAINNFLVSILSNLRQSFSSGLTSDSTSSLIFGSRSEGFVGSPFIRFIRAITSGYDTYAMDIVNNARMHIYSQSPDVVDNDDVSNGITDSSQVAAFALIPALATLGDGLITGYQHVSILDSVTSRICVARSGLTWDINYQPIDHNFPFEIPPLHFNCRSSIIPIIGALPAVALTASSFFAGLSTRRQDSVFGTRTAQLFREGQIEQQDLLDELGRPRTLQEAIDSN